MDHIVRIGYDRVLQPADIPLINNSDNMRVRFGAYKQYLKKHVPTEKTRFIELWAVFYAVRWKVALCLLTKILNIGCQLGSSLLSQNLIREAESLAVTGATNHNHGKAVGYLMGFTAIDAISILTQLFSWFTNMMLTSATKTLGMNAIHDKMLRLGPQQRHDYSAAKITAISGSDCSRASNALTYFSDFATFPINLGASLGILIYFIHVSALPGIGLILLGIFISTAFAYYVSTVRGWSMPYMDKRISLARETLKNINILKFYGWEEPFSKLIERARKAETKYIRIIEAIDSANISLVIAIPSFAGALSFAVRIIINSSLGPAGAFPALMLFQTFVQTMSEISMTLTGLADARVAVKRLDKFFRLPEVPSYIETLTDSPDNKDVLFKVDNADFAWLMNNEVENDEEGFMIECEKAEEKKHSREESKTVLKGVNVTIKRGTMNLVVGKVGSGKTSLLSIFLNSIPKATGSVSVAPNVKTVGVLSQWSSSTSVRDNILFGLPYNSKKYEETIRICDLTQDLETFAHGDKTEIGENGVTLSGGQRARLALARCIYASEDLIILDDILSAMDSKVGGFVFKELLELTRSGKRTVVFSTNNQKWVSDADTVITLDGNGNAHQTQNAVEIREALSSTDTPTSNEDSDSAKDFNYRKSEKEEFEKSKTEAISHAVDSSLRNIPVPGAESGDLTEMYIKDKADATFRVQESVVRVEDEFKDRVSNDSSDLEKKFNNVISGSLTAEEDRAVGSVSNKVLIKYFRLDSLYGFILFFLMMLSLILFSTSQSMSNVILNWWTGNKYPRTQGFYIGIYVMDSALIGIFYAIFAVIFSLMATSSSTSLHNGALRGLYGTTTTFFHQNPLGRLMTRFTEDLVALDTMILMFGRETCIIIFPLIASLVVIFVYIPWAILCLIPIFLIAGLIFAFYLPTTRELARCNMLFQSRAMQVLTEHIEGQEVIVSYDQTDNCQNELNSALDDNMASNVYENAIHFWAGVRSGLLCEIITLATLFLAIFNVFNLDPAEVGLMISMLPSIRMNLMGLLIMSSMFYNQLNSVERLEEYATKLPVEGASVADRLKLELKDWHPTHFDIQFDHACFRYREDLPLALNDLTFHIKSGKKVGICGRTGAGKSTIISALFRFVELSGGSIKIGGQDIVEIPLATLRNAFAIIPQAPILFQGTIRSNLDPFEQYDNATLTKALQQAGLTDNEEGKFKLEAPVVAEGTNLSLGERQMIALARVLVRNSSILILDEATAAVDQHTDEQIQKAIKAQFSDRTILCIAHRLETIIDYDVIMVMGPGGVLLEMGSPAELYRKNGVFTDMCKEAEVIA